VLELAVPEVARRAVGTVPEPRLDAFKAVRFVPTPDEGVPKAPPFTTTAPAVPVFTANAVATPVPSPDTPVEIGKPVAFVSVADDGVPNAPPEIYKVPV
jgi:hypothetical protein